jgi:carbamoyltransferase
LAKMDDSASLGYFYSNATEAMGWRHGSGEWKVMGLAPYGTPQPGTLKGYYPEFADGELVKPRDYGRFGRWNDHGANHYHGQDSVPLEKLVEKLGREDFAAETQRVVEEEAFKLILPWIKKEKARHLCCAGGFFLNVKFNQRLWYTGELETQWIYPDCGDSGLPVGAAFDAYFSESELRYAEKMEHLYHGPEFFNDEIKQILDDRCLSYRYVTDPAVEAAGYLSENRVIGWFQGRMEAGPRALGNRSILMSPLKADNKDIINAKVKYREKFRPFCPSLLHERRDDYLVNARDEFFMVTSFDVKQNKKDKIPAVVHVDGTARPQMVRKEINPIYHQLICEFEKITGEAIILNTSFNVRGEPIVCNPREAIRCFYDTGLDVLVLGNFILEKPILGK